MLPQMADQPPIAADRCLDLRQPATPHHERTTGLICLTTVLCGWSTGRGMDLSVVRAARVSHGNGIARGQSGDVHRIAPYA
jgi:hypothetical protein